METIPAATVKQWLETMAEIEAALKLAENIPGIEHDQWNQIWRTKCRAFGMRSELMDYAVSDVPVETADRNQMLHDIFKPGLMTGFPRTEAAQ